MTFPRVIWTDGRLRLVQIAEDRFWTERLWKSKDRMGVTQEVWRTGDCIEPVVSREKSELLEIIYHLCKALAEAQQ